VSTSAGADPPTRTLGLARRPAFEDSSGSTLAHCSSENTRYPEDVTPSQCREPQPGYGRHALVDVTNDDIAAAKAAWLDALRGGAPADRGLLLCDDDDRLTWAQARQIARLFRDT
jgi:hypothetical protein